MKRYEKKIKDLEATNKLEWNKTVAILDDTYLSSVDIISLSIEAIKRKLGPAATKEEILQELNGFADFLLMD